MWSSDAALCPPTQPWHVPGATQAGISNTRPPTGSKPSQNHPGFFSRLAQIKQKAEISEDVDSLLLFFTENDPNLNAAHHKQFQSNCDLLELNDTISAVGPIHKQTPKKNGMKEDKLR